ncbi:MAG: hypothetical protein K6G16_01555 [Lachnospiraceae bacterium]|nr:hypothetical protein [Lachnospiraceae bacterium]
MRLIGERKNQIHTEDLKTRAKRTLRTALCVLLSLTLTGCTSILGDGEISVVTAPPIVTPQVVVYDSYGMGDMARFDIGGTDAFYLLPGIENVPDYMQDFNCLDYTDKGYFVYYYCAPAYISEEQVIALKGTEGTAPEGAYPSIDRGSEALCDAMIVMAYHPKTRKYYVMDAQAYGRETANSMTEGEANTGMDFYPSGSWGFYTLSHCYGCKVNGQHRYFIFDQNGDATVYDGELKELSRTAIGGYVMSKTEEIANELNLNIKKAKNQKKSSDKNSGTSGVSESDLADGGEEMEEAIKELEQATGEKFDTGKTEDEDAAVLLNCLVKSAVMDGGNIMYLTLMLYNGESPWASEYLLSRVVSIYNFDLSGDQLRFVSTNVNHQAQVAAYLGNYRNVTMDAIKRGSVGTIADSFTGFLSDIEGFAAFFAGYGDLAADGGLGYQALAYSAANNGQDTNLALSALANHVADDLEDSIIPFTESMEKKLRNMRTGGYSNKEYYKIERYLTDTKAIEDFSTYSISFLWDLLVSSKSVRNVLLEKFIHTTDLSRRLGSQAQVQRVEQDWLDMPQRARTTLTQSLLGYYNRSVSSFLSLLGTGKLGSSWNNAALTAWYNNYKNRRGGKVTPGQLCSYSEYQDFLNCFSLLPKPGAFNGTANAQVFPTAEGAGRPQALIMIHGTNEQFLQDADLKSVPRASVLNLPAGSNIWVEPCAWNEEIDPSTLGPVWITDTDAAKRVLTLFMTITGRESFAEELADHVRRENEQQVQTWILGVVAEWNDRLNRISQPGYEPAEGEEVIPEERRIKVDAEEIVNAAYGKVKEDPAVAKSYAIPAGTYPVAYRLRFPKGTKVDYVDVQAVEGSATSSVVTGVLLFADKAKDTKNGLVYTSEIRWKRESGISFEDTGVGGAAIDTGSLRLGNDVVLMLITEDRVKFYPSQKGVLTPQNAYELTNEQLLSSTGFTPYTESGTQAAVSTRLDSAGLPDEKYKDKNKVEVTQEQVAKSLNSSRVGTIQASTSFTMLSQDEVMISAYDSGLSLLRLNATHDVLHLQSGSYYQSFPEGTTGNYKVVGFDTEAYMYGSKDLARAKVYDFNAGNRKQEIYTTAIESHLDQLAVDYVRRLHRTRTQIEQDKDGKITKQTVVIVPFNEDTTEEAKSEKILFAGAMEEAVAELTRLETAVGITHTKASEEYLETLRKRVGDQQKALNEVFTLTRADKIGTKINTDPYWVGIKERLQSTSDMGDFKGILAEIATSEEMIRVMQEEAAAEPDETLAKLKKLDAETYQQFHDELNYKGDEKKQNETLAEVGVGAEKLTELLENRKTAKDFEEQYDELSRGKAQETDPLTEALNTDKLRKDTKENKTVAMEARALIIEDLENNYFVQHPLPAQKEYAPNGEYKEIVTSGREDVVWETYLTGLLSRINPNNLAAARSMAAEEFAKLSWTSARTMQNGQITTTALTVDAAVQEKMKKAILDGIDQCETLYQVEALFFGTQAKYLGNPYGAYRGAVTEWEKKTFATEAEKAKAMRASEWYQNMHGWLVNDAQIKDMLTAKGQTWEEYIGSVITHRTGRVLRDEQTGESSGGYTSAASTFAQLVEFLCEGAGEVKKETKIELVEDLLIGMYNISGAEAAEEAVLIERMNLPAYQGYQAAYDAFNTKSFDDEGDQVEKSENTVSMALSSGASLRQQALKEQDFYKKLIVSMQESELVKAYLAEQKVTWEQYMASLPSLAQNENITDPAASAKKIYEDFTPYVPREDKDKAAEKTQDRPTATETKTEVTETEGNK